MCTTKEKTIGVRVSPETWDALEDLARLETAAQPPGRARVTPSGLIRGAIAALLDGARKSAKTRRKRQVK
jgi:hypothetical protein